MTVGSGLRDYLLVWLVLPEIIQAVFARQRFFMNTVILVFVFTEEMHRLHVVVLLEVNYACGMWACRFWHALEVQHDAL